MFEAHFQSFDDRTDSGAAAERVKALRTELFVRGLDGFIVPRADRFQNEYVPPSDERLAWLTGFSGSAGMAIILADRAVLFVDGRYQVQVRDEVDAAVFTIEHLVENPPPAWIKANVPAGAKLGYSPWLHTIDGAERLAKACGEARATFVAVDDNPIDAIWTDRPEPPLGPVVAHDMRYAGEEAASKLARIRAELAKDGADTLMVSDPHAVSWLFNIRGSDVPHTPVVLAFATVPKDGRPTIFVDLRKVGNEIRAHLEEVADVRPNAAFERDMAALGEEHRAVRLDPATCPEAIARLVTENGGSVVRGPDPITPMKAVKNAVEIEGARAAQLRDGVAVTRFLAWFERAAARGESDGNRRGRGTGELSPRKRPAQGHFFPDHRRRRTERRHRALPRDAQDQPAHRLQRSVSARFRRPIRRRHHRHHPHDRGRRAERRDAAQFHAGAQRPYRHRARGLPGRHHRRAARFVRAAISVARRPRFRSRHRPWRRQLFVGA